MIQFFSFWTQNPKMTRIHKKLNHFFIKYVYTQYYYNIVKPHTIHITPFPHNSHMMNTMKVPLTAHRDPSPVYIVRIPSQQPAKLRRL